MIFSILSSTTFKKFPTVSDVISEVSKFQLYTKLCSKCHTFLISSLYLSTICKEKNLPLTDICFSHENPGLSFKCTSCIVLCHAVFHILQVFLIYHNLFWHLLRVYAMRFRFLHIHFHSIVPYNFNQSTNRSL